jgi:hypothetical protein
LWDVGYFTGNTASTTVTLGGTNSQGFECVIAAVLREASAGNNINATSQSIGITANAATVDDGLNIPLIEAADCTNGGNNTATTSWAVPYPAYEAGDLLIFNIGSDAAVTHNWSSTGPDGETVVDIVDSHLFNTTEAASAFYFIGGSTQGSGTFTVTPSASEQWVSTVVKVPAGEFYATTPIQSSVGTGGSVDSGTTTNVPSPAWTADDVGYGRIVVWLVVDADPITATPTGWTTHANQDIGAVAGALATRDLYNTASESIASANWTIVDDSSSTIGYVINRPSAAANTEISGVSQSLDIAAQAASLNASNQYSAVAASKSIAAQAATIALSVALSATSDSISITAYTASLENATGITANSQSLDISPQAASINAAIDFAATSQSLSITTDAATVSAGSSISAASQALSITANAAESGIGAAFSATSVSFEVSINQLSLGFNTNTTEDAKSITTSAATPSLGFSLDPGEGDLDIAVFAAQINASHQYSATADSFTITPGSAVISVGAAFASLSQSFSLDTNAATVFYANTYSPDSVEIELQAYPATLDNSAVTYDVVSVTFKSAYFTETLHSQVRMTDTIFL